MAMDALSKFSSEVLRDAEAKCNFKIAEIEDAEKERLDENIAKIKAAEEERVRTEKEKLRLKKELSSSLLRTDLKREITKRRNEMFNEIFTEISKNILDYAKSEDYKISLSKLLSKAVSVLGDTDTVCYARKSDIEFLKGEFKTLEFKEAKDSIIGGFTAENPKKHLLADFTLKSKIEEEKKNFFKNSGLVLNR